MSCPRCGTVPREGARFCQRCGLALEGRGAAPAGEPLRPAAPLPAVLRRVPRAGRPTAGLGAGALVCGILSLVICWVPFVPLVLGLLAVGLAWAALWAVKRGTAGGKGLAVAGLVCGLLGTGWGLVYSTALVGWRILR